MQKLRSILKIGSSGVALCDNYGATAGVILELMYATAYQLEFELRSDAAGASAQLADYPVEELSASAYYCAFDFSCRNSDEPPLLIFSGVDIIKDDRGRTVFTVPLDNCIVSDIADALKENQTTELFCELGGVDNKGTGIFAWQFPVTLRNRVYSGIQGSSTVIPDPAYYTAVQVKAITGEQDSRITAVEAQLDTIGQELSGVVSELEEQVKAITGKQDSRITAVEAQLDAIGQELSGVVSELEEI